MGEKEYSPQACVIWHQGLITYYWVWLCSLFATMVIWFYHSLAVLILLNWVYIVSYQVTKSIYWKDYYLLLGEAKQSCFISHYSGDSFLVNLFLISPIMWSISKIQSDLPSCKLHMRKQLLPDRLNLLPGTLLGEGMGNFCLFISPVHLRADMWALCTKNIVQLFRENDRVHSPHPQKGWELSVLVKWASLVIQTTTLSLMLSIAYRSTCYLWVTNFHTINIWELWGHCSHHSLCGIHSPKMASNELCFPIFMTSYCPLHIEAGLILWLAFSIECSGSEEVFALLRVWVIM